MNQDESLVTSPQRRNRLVAIPVAVVSGIALVLGAGLIGPQLESEEPSDRKASGGVTVASSPSPPTSVATEAAAPTSAPSISAVAEPVPPISAVAEPVPPISAVAEPAAPRGASSQTLVEAGSGPVRGGMGELPRVAAPLWLTVEAASIDQPIVALTPTIEDVASQSIVPPMTIDAYWLTSYGSPGEGSQNTTYITGHSWEGVDAPFDRLSTHVAPGDLIVVGTETGEIRYIVESVTTHNKDTLKNSDIWNIIPNRLVLISCYTQDPWGKNVIVSAVPV